MPTPQNPQCAPSSLRSLTQAADVDSPSLPTKTDSQSPPLHLPTKRRGEVSEAAFLHKAAGLGVSVAKPWGDSDRYDFILDFAGRLSRVQVKTASRVGNGAYSIHACGSDPGRIYTREEIDFLIAYIVSENLWYVFPVRLFIKIRHVKLHPFRKQPLSRYEKYREAWDYMRNPESSDMHNPELNEDTK
jgi:PD-(D/E)XK endonuclease